MLVQLILKFMHYQVTDFSGGYILFVSFLASSVPLSLSGHDLLRFKKMTN